MRVDSNTMTSLYQGFHSSRGGTAARIDFSGLRIAGAGDSASFSPQALAMSAGEPPQEFIDQMSAFMKEQDPETFASLDGDGDGSLSRQEFATGLERLGPPPGVDGMLSMMGQRMQEEDPELFAALDGDGDGSLTARELQDGEGLRRQDAESKGLSGGGQADLRMRMLMEMFAAAPA
jgi:hypothetical protein